VPHLTDTLATIKHVVRVAGLIKQWIDESAYSSETMNQISTQAQRIISAILEPLRSEEVRIPTEFHPSLMPAILALGATLNKTLEHIRVWSSPETRYHRKIIAFRSPAKVAAIFQEHEKNINRDANVLQLAIIAVMFRQMAHREVLIPPKTRTLDLLQNHEIVHFWKTMVGEEVRACFPFRADARFFP